MNGYDNGNAKKDEICQFEDRAYGTGPNPFFLSIAKKRRGFGRSIAAAFEVLLLLEWL